MSRFYEWFIELASIEHFMYFLAGFASAYVLHCVREKLADREVKLPWQLAGIAIGTVAILVTTFQSSSAYNQARDTAAAVQACSKEFHAALTERSRIAAENDKVSQNQRKILWGWLHDIVFPPAPYAQMEPSDPRRQDWGIARTISADRALARSFDDQDVLQAQRDAHPLPDPTCGR